MLNAARCSAELGDDLKHELLHVWAPPSNLATAFTWAVRDFLTTGHGL